MKFITVEQLSALTEMYNYPMSIYMSGDNVMTFWYFVVYTCYFHRDKAPLTETG